MAVSGSSLQRYAPAALAALRIIAALLFLAHGTQKILGFPPPSSPMPAAFSLFWIGGIIEIVTGVLIALGLYTRPAAFLASGQMAYAYFAFHAPRNFFPALNGGDASILFCFIFLYLVFAGAGAFSLDGNRR
ncbi:DoxX family protein [Roseomonas sp. KE0001]|uniref:DoxX family protein n=1 Tax=unclassified Roseomonas TaxID=2617492 RepID=UPI0018DFBDD1|nr:DoxX family protein [Roseomonas sp. KE0001]MBI0432686.1 DoxX family protein [Roseomonas sp. KE0001]